MFSNVEFKSNLYPLKDAPIYDHEFLSQIHDVFALEKLKKNYINPGKVYGFRMSELQEAEYKTASGHCSYAPKDDYVWGTIVDTAGKARVVCKCTNTTCRNFNKCRKDFFDESEINNPPAINDAPEIHTPPIQTAVVESDAEIESAEIVKPAEELIENPEPKNFVESIQEKIIKSAPNEKIIVDGGPGTGKTWTLIQKIVYMIDAQGISAEKILVFCFSRAAVEVVRSRIAQIAKHDCQNIDIRTFDSFATYLLAFAKENLPELLPQNYKLELQNYNERINQAISILKARKNILDSYNDGNIFVDEVQDLVGVRAELVIELLKTIPKNCGFTLFGDSCQSLYDYLAENNKAVMTSENFYANIFQEFPKVKRYSLTVNHRQNDNLKNLIDSYREKLSEKNYGESLSVLENEIKPNLPPSNIKLKDFDQDAANEYLSKGTLGILTRTNGQALQISSWLWNNQIEHSLQRNSRILNFGDWLAKIFYTYPNSTISESDFLARHLQVYPNSTKETAIKRWNALANTQNEILPRYEVENLLKGVVNNAKDNILFEGSDNHEESITVSNIHRAKGKEFDSVILLSDVVNLNSNDNISEHKICYVGLTRAKNFISIAEIDASYNYIIQNENRRCYKGVKNSRTGKRYLSQFEVGIEGDVDNFSSRSEEVQNFIAEDLKAGTAVYLKKCPEGTRKYITYEIVIEEPRYLTLGYTGKVFAVELEHALKRILDLNNVDVYYKIFPNELENIYIDEIITCISGANVKLPAAKNFGDMKIWYSFSIVGLAKVVKDRH